MTESRTIKFSPDQQAALTSIDEWLNSKDPRFFSLMGGAGTGKTTIAKYVKEKVQGTVFFLAFTGKAALVMQRAGCEGAQTIHSLIYSPQERSKKRLTEVQLAIAEFPEDGDPDKLLDLQRQLEIEMKNSDRPMFKLRSDSDLMHASLAIVDECSMVDEMIGSDLLSFGVPILALGDPGQLAPIRGRGYFTKSKPNHLLTDIHRQAKGSPIIKMASIVREGGTLEYKDYGQGCSVVRKNTQDLVMGCDQVIVGRNKTRKMVNNRVREIKGLTGEPKPGEKLVCLKNNPKIGLLNGSQWELVSIDVGEDTALLKVKPWQDEGEEVTCIAHMHYFEDRDADLPSYEKKEAEEFDFGYAITAHKSQGSQWDSVLVIDESNVFEEPRRHLYTAITRAVKKVVVVL